MIAGDLGARIVAAARADIGRPFRPQGREPDGLDCVGLAIRAVAGAGLVVEVPRHPLRGHSPEQVTRWLSAAGFVRWDLSRAEPGDLLLAFPATRLAHLAVRSSTGFIEANAGLRRVVERPWRCGEGWHSAWRSAACVAEGNG